MLIRSERARVMQMAAARGVAAASREGKAGADKCYSTLQIVLSYFSRKARQCTFAPVVQPTLESRFRMARRLD